MICNTLKSGLVSKKMTFEIGCNFLHSLGDLDFLKKCINLVTTIQTTRTSSHRIQWELKQKSGWILRDF